MMESGAAGGTSRPDARLFRRVRVLLLLVVAAASLVIAYRSIATSLELSTAARWLASVALAAGVSFLHLRHLRGAVAVALSPLAGLLVAAALPHAFVSPSQVLVAAYALAVVAANLMADAFTAEIMADGNALTASVRAFLRVARPALLAVVAAVLILIARGGNRLALPDVPGDAIAAVCAMLSTLILLPLALSLIGVDELYVAGANRRREARILLAYRVSMVAVPRWGLSLSGVALVFGVLAYFDAGSAGVSGLELAGLSLLILLISYAVAFAWRDALGALLAIAVAALFDVASVSRVSAAAGTGGLAVLFAGGILATLAVQDSIRRLAEPGEERAIARLRAVEELAGPVTYAALAAIAAVLPWLNDGFLAAPIPLAAGALSALVFAPALGTALDAIVPRRRSVEELYMRTRR